MELKKTLGRIVLSASLALAGCGNKSVKTIPSANEHFFGAITGDFNGDGKEDIAFVNIRKEDIYLCEKDSSSKWRAYKPDVKIDWDKAYSGKNYLKLVIMDHDEDMTDSKTVEKYLMDFAGSNFDK